MLPNLRFQVVKVPKPKIVKVSPSFDGFSTDFPSSSNVLPASTQGQISHNSFHHFFSCRCCQLKSGIPITIHFIRDPCSPADLRRSLANDPRDSFSTTDLVPPRLIDQDATPAQDFYAPQANWSSIGTYRYGAESSGTSGNHMPKSPPFSLSETSCLDPIPDH